MTGCEFCGKDVYGYLCAECRRKLEEFDKLLKEYHKLKDRLDFYEGLIERYEED